MMIVTVTSHGSESDDYHPSHHDDDASGTTAAATVAIRLGVTGTISVMTTEFTKQHDISDDPSTSPSTTAR
jgi:hypothetical protein